MHCNQTDLFSKDKQVKLNTKEKIISLTNMQQCVLPKRAITELSRDVIALFI